MTDESEDDVEVRLETVPEDAACTEFVGEFADFEDFARAALETLVHEDGMWLLDCLDWVRVREVLEEGGRYRYRVAGDRMFRDTLRPATRTIPRP